MAKTFNLTNVRLEKAAIAAAPKLPLKM